MRSARAYTEATTPGDGALVQRLIDLINVRNERRDLEEKWAAADDWYAHVFYASPQQPACGTPVVLLTGLALGGYSAVPLTRELGRLLPTYAPAPPGYAWSAAPKKVLGLSELAEVTALTMSALEVDAAVVVGSSLGAHVAAELAARYPSRVRGLVLLAPPTVEGVRDLPRQALRRLRNATRERAFTRGMLVDMRRAGARRLWHTLRMARRERLLRNLREVTVPAVVVRGERDAVVAQREVEAMASGLRKGRTVVIPGKAHHIERTAAREVAAVVHGMTV